jgi:hypothetical protein
MAYLRELSRAYKTRVDSHGRFCVSLTAKTGVRVSPAVAVSNVLTTPAKIALLEAGLRVDPSAGVPISGLPLESIPVTKISTPVPSAPGFPESRRARARQLRPLYSSSLCVASKPCGGYVVARWRFVGWRSGRTGQVGPPMFGGRHSGLYAALSWPPGPKQP